MNKFITVAALLAAGTAFANADIASDFFPASDTVGFHSLASDSVPNLLFNSHAGYAAYNNVFNSVSSGSWYQVGVSNKDPSSSGAGVTWDSETGSLGIGYASVQDGTIAYMWNTISAEDLTSVTSLGLSFDVVASEAALSNTLSVVVYYIAASSATSAEAKYLGGVDIDLVSVSSVVSYSVNFDSFATDISKEEDGKFAVLFKTSGSVWASSTLTTVSNLRFTGTAIPEPSAFGLLAGVGALALVAARRRRTK